MEERKLSPCFDSNDVMAYILGVCEKNDIPWNATKAQKLMYCCYGTVLAAFGDKLTEEAPQAWQYGPVFPRTFNGLRKNRIKPGEDHGFSTACDPKWLPLIDQTVKTFGKFTASELSTWSHKNGSPWARATNNGKELLVQIPASYIAEYFEPMINRVKDADA
jgi:uncharacterized phage-associated protein